LGLPFRCNRKDAARNDSDHVRRGRFILQGRRWTPRPCDNLHLCAFFTDCPSTHTRGRSKDCFFFGSRLVSNEPHARVREAGPCRARGPPGSQAVWGRPLGETPARLLPGATPGRLPVVLRDRGRCRARASSGARPPAGAVRLLARLAATSFGARWRGALGSDRVLWGIDVAQVR